MGGVLPVAEDFFSPTKPLNFHPPTKQQRACNQPIKGFLAAIIAITFLFLLHTLCTH